MKKFIYSTLALALPMLSLAAGSSNGIDPIELTYPDKIKNQSFGDFNSLFLDYVKYAINLFWVLTVLFGIFAAFKYLTAKGDPKAADSAKQMVKYTIIAACVALLATVIKEIAKSILGGGASA